MAEFVLDTSQLDKLAADLRAHGRKTPAETVKIVSKGALNVKRDWQRAWSGLGHAPYLASAVTYDVKLDAGSIEADIGPDKGRPQGALGNIIEFGTSKNGPRPGGAPALAREEPRYVSAAEKMIEGLLK